MDTISAAKDAANQPRWRTRPEDAASESAKVRNPKVALMTYIKRTLRRPTKDLLTVSRGTEAGVIGICVMLCISLGHQWCTMSGVPK